MRGHWNAGSGHETIPKFILKCEGHTFNTKKKIAAAATLILILAI